MRQTDLRQERDAVDEAGDTAPQHQQAAHHGEQRRRDDAEQQRERHAVVRAGDLEESVLTRRDVLAADAQHRLVAALAVEGRGDFAPGGGRLAPAVPRGSGGARGAAVAAASPTAALALVDARVQRRSDQLAAVAVLVYVGGEVVLRVLEVGVRVLAVELAVVLAVLDHVERARLRDGRQRQGDEQDADDQLGCSAEHVRISPWRTGWGGRSRAVDPAYEARRRLRGQRARLASAPWNALLTISSM